VPCCPRIFTIFTKEKNVKINEFAESVSVKSGVDPQAAEKVLDAAFAMLSEQMAKGEKIELQGLGTFVRKEAKEPGKKARTIFKPWGAKAAGAKGAKGGKGKKNKAARKQKQKARKAAKEKAS